MRARAPALRPPASSPGRDFPGAPRSARRAAVGSHPRTRPSCCRKRSAGTRRFVYGSTMGVYGDASQQQLDEQSEVRPENPYQETKLEAEALVRARAYDFDTAIVRIAETYGPGDWRLLKLFRAIERGQFFMIGPGTNRRQCIHVNDLVRGLWLAAEHPSAVGETFILAGREVMTTNEMVECIATALDRKPPRVQLPMWPFLAAATVLETTCLLYT